ncbi:MAG: helix-turn-helix domain-containing protein [Bacillota bacterium]|nr:helix-turn-helix domain-containing protein [Bacillota bacterium]
MMIAHVSCTEDGVKSYPAHKHNCWEIMLYLSGEGYLYTPKQNYLFKPGTIIIVPPKIIHGSVSKTGFKNISIAGNFENILLFNNPISIQDNENSEGKILASLLYNNSHNNSKYINDLATAYISFILQKLQLENSVSLSISKIICEIAENAYDCNIKLSEVLNRSGYAEDYIRQQFKKVTGTRPTEFLTKMRIKRACLLIEIYGSVLSLNQIAEQCGYMDYIYFSKKFKLYTGISPNEYRKKISVKN